jgi:hypothetical protein
MMFMGVTHHTQKFQEPVTPKLITWCHIGYAEMLLKVRTKGKGQVDIAEIPTLLHPSQPITGGHRQNAEMPLCYRPHQFTRCQIVHAEMLLKVRTKGKGQRHNTEMSIDCRPSQPITGGHRQNAEMPLCYRPHQFYLVPSRLCRNANLEARQGEGSSRYRRNAKLATPFPTNHMGPSSRRSNASGYTPHRIWAMRYSQKCQATAAQITPTRGQSRSAK